jgi:PAS domain S-box-containing protein
VESANSIILRWDLSGKITFFNEYASRFFGYLQEEIIGQNLVGIIVPATDSAGRDLAEMIRDIEVHPERYEVNQNENMRKDGTRVWVAWTNRPILDDQGQCVEILSIGNDITDRRRAEEALCESEARYRNLVEGSPDIVYSFSDKRGGFYYSSRVETVLGYSPAELYADPFLWNRSIHPKDLAHVGQAVAEFGQGKAFDVEYRIRDKAGNWLWFNDRSIRRRVEEDEVIIDGLASDITDRKRAEEALTLAHEHLRCFVDANIVGVIIGTPAGELIEANDYYLNLLGFTRDEFNAGKLDWRAVTPPEWLFADKKCIRELRERGTCTPYEKEYIRRDGSRVPVLLADALLPGPEQQIVAFVLDLTERRRAEAALRESEEKFRNLFNNAEVGMFRTRMDGSEVLDANNKYLSIHGGTSEEIVGKPTTILWADPKEREEMLRALQAQGCVNDIECRLLTTRRAKSGSVSPRSDSIQRLESWTGRSSTLPSSGGLKPTFSA